MVCWVSANFASNVTHATLCHCQHINHDSSSLVTYSLHFKIKVTFGEVSLKLRQMNWNVARNNVNVVVDELPSQITFYTYLTVDIWTQQRRCTSMRFYALRCHPPKLAASSEIGAKSFQLYYGHP